MNISSITDPIYYQQLRNYAVSNPPHLTKVEEVVHRLLAISHVEEKIFAQTEKMLKEIASVKPGYELFERFLKILPKEEDKRLSINEGDGDDHCNGKGEIYLGFDQSYYYVSINDKGERILVQGPSSAPCFHELVHAIHKFEDTQVKKYIGSCGCIMDIEMDNEEEQLTITGFSKVDFPEESSLTLKTIEASFYHHPTIFGLKDRCCENSYLIALGYPPRINHNGPLTFPPTLIDVCRVGAIGTLKEKLQSQPELKNYVGNCKDAHKNTMNLLSAAAYYEKEDIVDFLLEVNSDWRIEDEIGGPILAAIKHDYIEFACDLIEKEIDVTAKDCEGMTALDYVRANPKWRFSTRHKPLIEKLEKISSK